MFELMQIVASVFATSEEEGGGEEGGGGGPSAAPQVSVYDYSGGTRFGIAINAGDASAITYLERDGSEYTVLAAGNQNVDIGLKSGDGTHTWRARHFEDSVYSSYSSTITTVNGVVQ